MPLVVNGSVINLDINGNYNAGPAMKQAAADVNALEAQNKTMSASEAGATDEMAGMASMATTLGAALTIAATAAGAFVAAWELGELAAGNERLRTSGELLADSYGESMDHIIQKVSEASMGTVSNMDIIASANKAMMLGVGGNAEQLANLMEIAAFRGRAMGLSTSQAFDDMARGIGRMSPMILDNLGIVVDAESTYANYAQSIGKTSSELTRAEKVQALLNKVIEEGNGQLERAGGLVEDNATSYEQWDASLENLRNNFAETFIGMSDIADMASQEADALSLLIDVTRDLGEESVLKLNLVSIATRWWQEETELAKQKQYEAADAVAAHGDALDEITPKVITLTEAQQAALDVDEDAVKGAMKVHDTYVTLDGKMKDLQVDHDELLAKKQELLNQGWWPESEKIQDVNEKLADNEQKQKDVTEAMQGTLTQMILNTAAAGLDAEGQLALARAIGEIDEATYQALEAQALLKEQYQTGEIDAQKYAEKTIALRDAVARLEDRHIKITADALFNEIRTLTTSYQTYNGSYEGNYSQLAAGGKKQANHATGTDGWLTVPPGFANDSYLVGLSSNEKYMVVPDGVNAQPSAGGGWGGGGGNTLILNNYSTFSFGTEAEAREQIAPLFFSLLQEAKSNGMIQ